MHQHMPGAAAAVNAQKICYQAGLPPSAAPPPPLPHTPPLPTAGVPWCLRGQGPRLCVRVQRGTAGAPVERVTLSCVVFRGATAAVSLGAWQPAETLCCRPPVTHQQVDAHIVAVALQELQTTPRQCVSHYCWLPSAGTGTGSDTTHLVNSVEASRPTAHHTHAQAVCSSRGKC